MQSANRACWRDAHFGKTCVEKILILYTLSSVLDARSGVGFKAVRDRVTELGNEDSTNIIRDDEERG